jgi:hypothetical protein
MHRRGSPPEHRGILIAIKIQRTAVYRKPLTVFDASAWSHPDFNDKARKVVSIESMSLVFRRFPLLTLLTWTLITIYQGPPAGGQRSTQMP